MWHRETWTHIKELDKPGAYRNECKSLIDRILTFTSSEAPIYGLAAEADVEKQDVSYSLLEEENFLLKNEVLSLREIIQSKENEIAELNSSLNRLQCTNQEVSSIIQDISLTEVDYVAQRQNNIIKGNLNDKLNDGNLNVLKNGHAETSEESDTVNDTSKLVAGKSQEDGAARKISDDAFSKISERDTSSTPEHSKGDDELMTLEAKYISVKHEKLVLENRIKMLTEEIALLKSPLYCSKLKLIEYDKEFPIIKQERYNLISELRQTKSSNIALKLRNDYLEERVTQLEDDSEQNSLCHVKTAAEDEDSTQAILNCYKSRLYEAYKEVSMKEERIRTLYDSISDLGDKFKAEKYAMQAEYAERLNESENKRQHLHDENIKLEETVRQQSKLIDHLQALVESKERKAGSKISCLRDN